MEFAEKKRKVEHLLRVRFPFSWVPPPIEPGPPRSEYWDELYKRRMAKVEAERASLMAKPDSEVEQLFLAAGTQEQAKAAMLAEIEEKGRFSSKRDADADFGYWSKHECWSLDESVALLLGKAPEVVTWKAVQPFVNISKFAKQYERLRNLALRAQAMNRGQSAVYPTAVLAWANEVDIQVPDALQAALARQLAKRQAAAPAEAPGAAQVEQPSSPGQVSEVQTTETASTLTTSDSGPSLSTDDICDAFAGVGMNAVEWRKALTKNRQIWLKACLATLGRPGANPVQGRWYPLKIAVALVTGRSRKAGAVAPSELDAAFRRKPLLRPIAKAWADLRADNPAWGE